ncbi:urease accessory protein UreF [Oceaniglobus roseus]|uniref:urease accessory protein UreF n=1 Tax=Oceaniglobus roseus TaxID=1737570 RepID=UPI000C7F256F|nr:urease accessory UreF family protein [Kandeliimicrobium roseum]
MTDAALLTLTQWLSPAFPLGAFAYSHGLEQAVAAGQVTCAGDLARWLDRILTCGGGLADATLLCATLRGEDTADTARALATSRERRDETEAQGTAFARTVTALGTPVPEGLALPVAVGIAARGLPLRPERIAALYLHAMMANLVSAAVRFVPLGQTEGQRVLADLHAAIRDTAARAATLELDDITACVPGADLAAMLHETLPVRIFRT